MLGLANDRKPRHSETTVGDEIESIPRRYIIQHRRKTMDEQAIEGLMKRITDYLVRELDKRDTLAEQVQDLEVRVTDLTDLTEGELLTEERVKEIAQDEATEAINNAEVNVDISA
jgi:hypothetical protein